MLLVFQAVESARTPWWQLIVRDIPHDAGAMVAYAMVIAFVGFIVVANRKKPS